MPRRPLRLRTAEADAEVRAGLDRIRAEYSVPGPFPPAVLAEAAGSAAAANGRADLRDVPFFTLDPPGSMDLDQAMHLERRGAGHRVRYAIADVAGFVRPGGALDAEARTRGVTLYLPDANSPLHPRPLSEGTASLLPGRERPAVAWTIDIDAEGRIADVDVRRALVRSRDRLDYATARHDGGDPRIALLGEIGERLIAAEAARGGVSLPLPEQEVVHANGGWALKLRGDLATEAWNAQISLLTGRAAARLMLDGGVGLLRTMPPAPAETVERLRPAARALGVAWPADASYGAIVRALDPSIPRHAAFLHDAAGLLRGAGYTAFDGTRPEQAVHAAVAAPYAHVTAPIRRLADRYATEVCLALAAGRPVPDWTRAALPELPEVMQRALRRANDVDHACVDLVEALLLRDHVGDVFDAVVVDVNGDRTGGRVQLAAPPVIGRCDGAGLPLGEQVRVRLEEADAARRHVRFSRAG
ncbi:RNB domain-containing ribonuclease [Actinomadura darangshiensis]|uniref:RNB domain-containing ribonuclease n=1 Tax=Actinomadura darangshiensis TaxID=705336 RepID=A0A4R5BD58_9ACTN|nr:RNB domain-containing ribonuclease [Actinomadura darangshiensis]TDD82710.1 RNB domain-containing ribonuclease [Actinomadura darangshiensis]